MFPRIAILPLCNTIGAVATEKIGRYEILSEQGRGGMATVYLARDPSFARQVAVKVLPPEFTHNPEFRRRFEREAQLIAALEHPAIVPVYDFGQEGDQPYIVMRYMPGGTLADRIGGQPMPLDEIVPIFQRLAEALDEAHSQNIVHRDLKPSNVLFDARGQAFLSDFGMAKLLQSSGTLTGTGGLVGTPAYMSPEQAAGEAQVDKRSDVYSLGIILYEMLSGRQPYKADTPMKVVVKHIVDPVPRLNVEEMGLPPDWNEIIAHALAKKPDERYPSAGTLAGAVSGMWSTLPTPEARRPTIPVPGQISPSTDTPIPPTQPVAKASFPTRKAARLWSWPWAVLTSGIGLCLIVVFVGAMIIGNPGGGGTPTATATATLARASVTPAATVTSAPTATHTTAPPTPTLMPTDTPAPPTPTATATARPTRRPPTPTQVPPTTPPTDTPSPPPPPPPAPPTVTLAPP